MTPIYRQFGGERCINCGIFMSGSGQVRASRVVELSPAEGKLLSSWLQSYEIPDLESRKLCSGCAEYVRAHANAPETPRWMARTREQVCAACGVSLFKARAVLIDEQKCTWHAILLPYLEHYKEGGVKVCYACNMSAKRSVAKQIIAESKAQDAPEIAELERLDEGSEIVQTIKLPSYSKLEIPNTVACVLCGSGDTGSGNVLLRTRQRLMLRHKLYIPSAARVCAMHSAPDANASTVAPPQTCLFTPEEIADMLFLLKLRNPVDLSDVKHLAPFTLKKWLGITLDSFEEFFNQTPKLVEHNDGRFALAVYLANKHTKECVTVLASLCQRPRELVESLVQFARESLEINAPSKSCDVPASQPQDEETEYYDVETLEFSD